MSNQTWRQFEQLALEIQRSLSPEANLTHNERLLGNSGAEYQCDVVLRQPIGQLQFICVLECKDHNDPVGSEIMRAFVAKVADLRIHQGVMISAAGFTDDALKIAHSADVKAYKLVDTAEIRWRQEALLPIVLISVRFGSVSARYFDLQGNPRSYRTAEGAAVPIDKMYLLDKKLRSYRPVTEVFEELWDVVLDDRVPSPDSPLTTDADRFAFYLGENRHEDIVLEATFTPRITYHYNRVSLESWRGFVDEQTGDVIHATYDTGPLDTSTILSKWPATTVKSEVPFVPVDFFYLCAPLRRKPRTPQHLTLHRTTGPVPDDAIEI